MTILIAGRVKLSRTGVYYLAIAMEIIKCKEDIHQSAS